jgi:predicted transport protein
MENLKFVKPEKIWLADHPELREKWVQERIADDPSILGIGDLVLKDKERSHPRAGRLDLLLQDSESTHRYEVEIQLGSTDESHIIRTIEYWDIERKRYPQYDHSAVIVAEDITARFLNVIGLFNGHIPLIAIQMNALKFGDQISLVFTTVMDQLALGLVEEDEEVQAVTDRNFWETERGTKQTVAMADDLFSLIKSLDAGLELKYNKFYIGLATNGQPNNFVVFRPRKHGINVDVKLPQTAEVDQLCEQAGFDVMDYDKKWGNYRFRLSQEEIKKNTDLLKKLFKRAYDSQA